jgi:hypothetical protein
MSQMTFDHAGNCSASHQQMLLLGAHHLILCSIQLVYKRVLHGVAADEMAPTTRVQLVGTRCSPCICTQLHWRPKPDRTGITAQPRMQSSLRSPDFLEKAGSRAACGLLSLRIPYSICFMQAAESCLHTQSSMHCAFAGDS